MKSSIGRSLSRAPRHTSSSKSAIFVLVLVITAAHLASGSTQSVSSLLDYDFGNAPSETPARYIALFKSTNTHQAHTIVRRDFAPLALEDFERFTVVAPGATPRKLLSRSVTGSHVEGFMFLANRETAERVAVHPGIEAVELDQSIKVCDPYDWGGQRPTTGSRVPENAHFADLLFPRVGKRNIGRRQDANSTVKPTTTFTILATTTVVTSTMLAGGPPTMAFTLKPTGIITVPTEPRTHPEATSSVVSSTPVTSTTSTAVPTATQTNPPSWGLDRIDQRSLPLDNLYRYPASAGKGVTVYVLDSGINVSLSEFGGRAVWGANVINNATDDDSGHGTFVAAIIAGSSYGVAKNASLVSVKCLDKNGEGRTSTVIRALAFVFNQTYNNVTQMAAPNTVVTMSVGGPTSSILNSVVNVLFSVGIAVVAAAGNDADDACQTSPASAIGSIAVGAMDRSDIATNYSNYGPCTNIYAPGSDITSIFANGSVDSLRGTSFAAPHVAGVVSLLWSTTPKADVADLYNQVAYSGTAGAVKRLSVFSRTANLLVYDLNASVPIKI